MGRSWGHDEDDDKGWLLGGLGSSLAQGKLMRRKGHKKRLEVKELQYSKLKWRVTVLKGDRVGVYESYSLVPGIFMLDFEGVRRVGLKHTRSKKFGKLGHLPNGPKIPQIVNYGKPPKTFLKLKTNAILY